MWANFVEKDKKLNNPIKLSFIVKFADFIDVNIVKNISKRIFIGSFTECVEFREKFIDSCEIFDKRR
jgi:hypothetical protein